jgi:hypothetical protein
MDRGRRHRHCPEKDEAVIRVFRRDGSELCWEAAEKGHGRLRLKNAEITGWW